MNEANLQPHHPVYWNSAEVPRNWLILFGDNDPWCDSAPQIELARPAPKRIDDWSLDVLE